MCYPIAVVDDAGSGGCERSSDLSPRSVDKPWVVREMSSSMMRQLGDKGIRVLPLLIEDCEIPPLLADLKYADFRTSFNEGLEELVSAIKR